MLESIGADIRQPGQVQGAIDKAHQLIPIQKFLSSLKNDVKETCAAVQTVSFAPSKTAPPTTVSTACSQPKGPGLCLLIQVITQPVPRGSQGAKAFPVCTTAQSGRWV
eukprot:GHUV01048251.1.p1 GENE.GHUV01048251.1~~GHUV01048251.1.p1  ORF type:complete len:108 (+),score=20.86 GHUV01048251.1:232-555(+)